MKAIYHCSCVNWPKHDVDSPGGLHDMIESGHDITFKTFCRNTDTDSRTGILLALGYILNDPHVRFMKGKLHGQTVYWIEHSAIEYVFK